MLRSYGINRSATPETEMDNHLEEFRHLGVTAIANVLDADTIDVLKRDVMRIYAAQEHSFGKDNLRQINEENLARALLAYSEPFLELARNEMMIEYVRRILGNYFLLALQNGIINMPGEEHHQSSWHRDLPYQNWVSSEPLAVNVYYCLDDYSAETGGTVVLPYSHHIDHCPSERYMHQHAVQVKAEAGSVLLFDSMIFHKAGRNRSKDTIRRGINHMYTRSVIRQQIDLPAMLHGRYADDPFLNMLLGYDARSAHGVDDYRNRRMHKSEEKN